MYRLGEQFVGHGIVAYFVLASHALRVQWMYGSTYRQVEARRTDLQRNRLLAVPVVSSRLRIGMGKTTPFHRLEYPEPGTCQ